MLGQSGQVSSSEGLSSKSQDRETAGQQQQRTPSAQNTQREGVSEMGIWERTRRTTAESSAGLQTVGNAAEAKCVSKPAPGHNDNVYKMDSVYEKLAAT